MIDNNNTERGELTLAFSLTAIEQLNNPSAVFADAETWSRFLGIVDSDTEQIQRVVNEHGLRQDFDMQGRDKWFALEEICETAATPRHVYIGATDDDMRVATLFCWEYVRVTKAAAKADWAVDDRESDSGIIARLFDSVRNLTT